MLDEDSDKKVIAYKITRENKLTKKNIIKFYQEEHDDDDYDRREEIPQHLIIQLLRLH